MKILNWIKKNYNIITLFIMILVLFRTCSINSNIKSVNKTQKQVIERLNIIDSTMVTNDDLKLEGLKSEKRMIQCTDRKLFDLNREKEIDDEIQIINNK